MKLPLRGSGLSGGATQRRVLIVDDHPIVRQGLRRMIELEPDLVVCGEVQTEREARTAIRTMAPDVVIVDISLAQGDGLELVRDVHAQQPELPRLVARVWLIYVSPARTCRRAMRSWSEAACFMM